MDNQELRPDQAAARHLGNGTSQPDADGIKTYIESIIGQQLHDHLSGPLTFREWVILGLALFAGGSAAISFVQATRVTMLLEEATNPEPVSVSDPETQARLDRLETAICHRDVGLYPFVTAQHGYPSPSSMEECLEGIEQFMGQE